MNDLTPLKRTTSQRMTFDKTILSFLKPELVDLIIKESSIKAIPKGTEILRAEQYVKVLPIVMEGLVKVYSKFEDKELLLYYIEPSQSCVMSFYAALKNIPSKVFAQTEEDSKIILIPVQYLPDWLKKYPDFNILFYSQYNLRFSELLETISHLLLNKMDQRLYEHLKRKTALRHQTSIKISHSQLANELGTAREVISRVIKKLENEGKVVQNAGEITIIGS